MVDLAGVFGRLWSNILFLLFLLIVDTPEIPHKLHFDLLYMKLKFYDMCGSYSSTSRLFPCQYFRANNNLSKRDQQCQLGKTPLMMRNHAQKKKEVRRDPIV